MTETEIEQIVAARCRVRTKPVPSPSRDEWQAFERELGCELPLELFHIRDLETRYWIQGEYLSVEEMRGAIEKSGSEHWDADLLPFYAVGNGDYLCVRRSEGRGSGVYYWAHHETEMRRLHASVSDYIQDGDWFC